MNINQLKHPGHLNMILFLICCFLRLILFLSYCGTENEKSHNMGVLKKGSLRVVFGCAYMPVLLGAT